MSSPASPYPTPKPRTPGPDTSGIPASVANRASVGESPRRSGNGNGASKKGVAKGAQVVKRRPSVEAAGTDAADADGPHGKRVYSPDEIAAAAAEAERVLQQPRYVAIAEQERHAEEEAAERRRRHMMGEPEEKNSPSSTPPLPDAKTRSLADDTPTAAAAGGGTSKRQRPSKKTGEKVKPSSSSSPAASPKRRSGGETAERTTPPPPAESSSSSAAAAIVSQAESLAKEAAAKAAREERAALATLKGILKGCGISTAVVPIVPLEKCAACDYCILLSDRASVDSHLGHIVRALCVTGMRVTFTAPAPSQSPTPTKGSRQAVAHTEANDASAPPTSRENADRDGNGKEEDGGEAEEGEEAAPKMRRLIRSMYCFLVEVVPISGDAEVVSIHVTLRRGVEDLFFNHHLEHFNNVAVPGVDDPFPSDASALTDAQKKRLMYLVLSHLVHEKAAVPADTSSVTVFPAHVDAMRDAIWEECIGEHPWQVWKHVQGADEDAIGAYFGEETMFYFAWMNHYQRWLGAASVVSVVTLLLSAAAAAERGGGGVAALMASGVAKSAAPALAESMAGGATAVAVLNATSASSAALAMAKSINGSLVSVTAAAAAAARLASGSSAGVGGAAAQRIRTAASPSTLSSSSSSSSSFLAEYHLPLFIVTLILGSVLCIKMWERRCNVLCMRYKLFQPQLFGRDEPRREFRGKRGENPITGHQELQFPGWYRGLVLQPLAWAIIAAFAAFTLFVMVAFVNLEGYTAYDAATGEYGFAAIPALRRFSLPGAVFNKDDHPLLGLVPTLLYSVCVSVLSISFKSLAERLTEMENYRYRGEFIRALTQKRIVFEFINSYAKLFFLAIVRQRTADLSTSLKFIFLTAVFTRLIVETIIPFMQTHKEQVGKRLRKLREKKNNRLTTTTTTDSTAADAVVVTGHGGSSGSALDEADERLDDYEVYSDYVEMAIQFGYIVLFAVAFPLAPVVAFFSNLIEVRSDLFKMCYVVRRPVPRLGLEENRTWAGVFRLMALASVLTNTILLAVSATPMLARFMPAYFAYHHETHDLGDGRLAVLSTPVLEKGMGRYAVFNAVVGEHIVMAVAVFLFWRISAFPRAVRVYMERRQYDRMSATGAVPKRRAGAATTSAL